MTELAVQSVEFDRRPPRRARAFVRSVLIRWGLHELVDDAELLVDELVANAMRHARGTGVDVSVRTVGDVVRIEVCDRDPDFTIDFQRPRDAPRRFGLRIVDSIASQWGVAPGPFGKVVWVELDSPHRSSLAS